jgi:LysM repeat protein
MQEKSTCHHAPFQSVNTATALSSWSSVRCLFRKLLHNCLLVALVLGSLYIAPAAHADDGVHVVQRGDTLASIAQRYQVSMRDLAANNGIVNPNIIRIGQRLVIPGSSADTNNRIAIANNALPAGDGYYTVQRGDTLAQVAQNNGMNVGDLLRLNGLTNPNFIWVGQKLRVTARVTPIELQKQIKPTLASTIHVVASGETLAQIADKYSTSSYEIMSDNGLPNPNFIWVGQRLRINNKPAPTSGILATNAPANGYRMIEVNLSSQTLTAWQGDVAVLYTSVSTGTWQHPTVTGRYSIGTKLTSQRMTGPGYDLPNVPYVMYFYSGYAIHGTYWHANFGTPMSHGCVNMRTSEAQFLFSWAPAGTEVYVHY